MTQDPEKFMRDALKEARKANKINEVPIGAVIVKDGKIVARGYNKREKSNKVSGHAEMFAISKANKKLDSWRLEGCDLYVTLEPCAMCTGAIIQARIRKIYFGAYDKKAGACGSVLNLIEDHTWNHKTLVESRILVEDCSKILTDFFKALREKK